MATLNEALQEAMIRHGVFLQRFGVHQSNRLESFLLDGVLTDVEARAAARMVRVGSRGFAGGPWRTKQLRELNKIVNAVARDGALSAMRFQRAAALEFAHQEAQFAGRMMERVMPRNFRLRMPSARTIADSVRVQPILGHSLPEHFSMLGNRLRLNTMRQLRSGLAFGDSSQDILRSLRDPNGALSIAARQGRALARTVTAHVSNQAREAVFKENGIKRVRWAAILDTSTTDICAGLDGRVFRVDRGPRPPMHHQCRSFMIPLASMKLPEKETYGEWLERQSAQVQNEALGVGKARLFRSGRVQIRDFTTSRYRSLTLQEVLDREGLVLADLS